MLNAIVKISDKVWLSVGGDVAASYCEICGEPIDGAYLIKDDEQWLCCESCEEKRHNQMIKWALNGSMFEDPRD